jgi:predicted porin
MKKVLAVAALLGLAGAAQAQVTIYGLIDMSVGQNEYLGEKNAQIHSGGDDGSSQGNSTTRIGFKGTTVVAPGVKANFQLETNGITSNGDIPAPTFNRQAWAGFSGSLGEIRVGKQDSVAFQTMIGFDFNGAANAASAQAVAGAGTFFGAAGPGGRRDRSLQYISNDLGGLKVQAGMQLKGDVANAEDSFALGVTYTAGPLAVAYTGESKRVKGGADFNAVAGSYDLGVAKIMLGYADGGKDAKGTTVGVVAPLAGVNVGLIYSKNSDTNVSGTELFVNKEIFKGTYAYFDYGNADKPNRNAYALGVIYTF